MEFDSPIQLHVKNGMEEDGSVTMDPVMLIVASAAAVCIVLASAVTCLCCTRRRHSRSLDSLRDTVQLADLLSKPSLADPESVFSEFRLDARLSEDTCSGAQTEDEMVQNSAVSSSPSSVVEMFDETRRKSGTERKGSHKAYRKESKKKSNAGLNNNNNSNKSTTSIYRKNTSNNNQTLQNDLAYVSSKSRKIDNKLENYDKKADALQQEFHMKQEKSLNVDKEFAQTDGGSCKSSLEVLDTNRYSSGSENYSFSSSARGSLCHDIGTSANAYRLPRPSIYPRYEGGDDMGSLPDVLESPNHSVVDVTAPDEDLDVLEVDEMVTVAPCSLTSDKLMERSKENQNNNLNVSGEEPKLNMAQTITYQNEISKDCQRDCLVRKKTKCLQPSYSVDKAFSEQHQRVKLPERISLNLQIDFHFPNEGQGQCEGHLPIVVCSPIAFNNQLNTEDNSKNKEVPRENHNNNTPHEPSTQCDHDTTKCCRGTTPTNDNNIYVKEHESNQTSQDDTSSEITIDSNKDKNIVPNVPVNAFNNNNEKCRQEGKSLHLPSKIPYWVQNRLSEPVELWNWVEKMSNSPNLRKRSFTIADFKSLKFKSVKNIDIEDCTENSTSNGNMTKSNEQSEDISSSTEKSENEHQGSTNAAVNLRNKSNRESEEKTEHVQAPDCKQNEISENIGLDLEDSKRKLPSPETDADMNTISSRLPNWARNRLSEPVGLGSQVEKMSNASQIRRKSFTVAELKSLTLTSVTSLDINYFKTRFPITENNEKPQEQANDVSLKIDKEAPKGVCEEKRSICDKATSLSTNQESSLPRVEDDSSLQEDTQIKDCAGLTKSNSLGFIPFVPFVPTLTVTSAEGNCQTYPRQTAEEYENCVNDDATEIGCSRIHPRQNAKGDEDSVNYDITEIGCSQTYPKPSRPKAIYDNEFVHYVTADESPEETIHRHTFPKSTHQKVINADTTVSSDVTIEDDEDNDDVTEIGCSNTFPKLPRQKAISADNTMEEDIITSDVTEVGSCQTYPKTKPARPKVNNNNNTDTTNTAENSNAASDDSDYDNPWDSLENAVKRASMKYHKRPSIAASSARDLMLKSAEDLGRLIEIAENKRRQRLNSTKSTCHDLDSGSNAPPAFTRISPLRHTVKGVMNRGSDEALAVFGGKPARGKAGSKSLRASKDDSVRSSLKTADDSKLYMKSKKLCSPESKKKVKKGH